MTKTYNTQFLSNSIEDVDIAYPCVSLGLLQIVKLIFFYLYFIVVHFISLTDCTYVVCHVCVFLIQC